MAVELALDLGLPLVGVRHDSLISELFVNFQRGIIEAEFDDRKIRSRGIEIIAQTQIGELKLSLIEVRECVAKVDQHEVALVSDQGEERGLAGRMLLHGSEGIGGFPCDGGLFGCRKSAPGGPSKTHHLVEDAVSLGGERNGGDFRSDLRTGLMSRRHESLSASGTTSANGYCIWCSGENRGSDEGLELINPGSLRLRSGQALIRMRSFASP